MLIVLDDPTSFALRPLIEEHLRDMRATSPPESVHALEPEALAGEGISFYSARVDGDVVGCGALMQLDASHGEIKSMRTFAAHRGRGYASALLRGLLEEARGRGYSRVSLETGIEDYFEAARRLYEREGFVRCAPFASYTDDPNSVYYTIAL